MNSIVRKTTNSLVELSSVLLLIVKLNKITTALTQQIRAITLEELQQQLSKDDAKKTF